MRTRQILCPTDFSETASHALGYAMEMARHYHVGIRLLHVIDRPFGEKDTRVLAVSSEELATRLQGDAAERMQKLISDLDTEVKMEVLIRHGHPTKQILDAAKEINAGMIVMASHGYTGLSHFLHPNVAEAITTGAECPVLVVK